MLVFLSVFGGAIGVVATRVHRIVVEGTSMEPALAPGDRLLVVAAFRLRPGDIVAVTDPRHRERVLVKRVMSADHGARHLSVEGDNREASTDSRHFGPVARGAVIGKVVYRYRPSERAGLLARRR